MCHPLSKCRLLCPLSLQAQRDLQTEKVVFEPQWTAGNNKRDAYRSWVRSYLAEALGESSPFIYARTSLIRALVAATDASCKWEFKLWPQTAKKYGLVLTGWGPNMCTDPTPQWSHGGKTPTIMCRTASWTWSSSRSKNFSASIQVRGLYA